MPLRDLLIVVSTARITAISSSLSLGGVFAAVVVEPSCEVVPFVVVPSCDVVPFAVGYSSEKVTRREHHAVSARNSVWRICTPPITLHFHTLPHNHTLPHTALPRTTLKHTVLPHTVLPDTSLSHIASHCAVTPCAVTRCSLQCYTTLYSSEVVLFCCCAALRWRCCCAALRYRLLLLCTPVRCLSLQTLEHVCCRTGTLAVCFCVAVRRHRVAVAAVPLITMSDPSTVVNAKLQAVLADPALVEVDLQRAAIGPKGAALLAGYVTRTTALRR